MFFRTRNGTLGSTLVDDREGGIIIIKPNDRGMTLWLLAALLFLFACNLAGTEAAPPEGTELDLCV